MESSVHFYARNIKPWAISNKIALFATRVYISSSLQIPAWFPNLLQKIYKSPKATLAGQNMSTRGILSSHHISVQWNDIIRLIPDLDWNSYIKLLQLPINQVSHNHHLSWCSVLNVTFKQVIFVTRILHISRTEHSVALGIARLGMVAHPSLCSLITQQLLKPSITIQVVFV